MSAESSSTPERLRLIAGLGNPGERYRLTRHNVGFRVLEALTEGARLVESVLECNAVVRQRGDLMLAAPQTFMNRSGFAVRCLVEKHDLSVTSVLVVYDDVALPLGILRLRREGSPGGHRGMESIIRNLRTDQVARLRLGVGPMSGVPPQEDLSDFVLANFTREEEKDVEEMIQRAAAACQCWFEQDIETAMNRFNG